MKAAREHATPTTLQQNFWNKWNSATRAETISAVTKAISNRQADLVVSWLKSLGRSDLDIIEIGCGTGWLCSQLRPFGRVTATDLADEALDRARHKLTDVKFVAGDFMALDFGQQCFDVAVSLEVLSHVPDQPAFLHKISRLLRPRGHLIMATQNRRALERNDVPPPEPGQLRRWVDRGELAALLEPEFDVLELFSVTPHFNRGVLRLISSRRLHRMASAVSLGSLLESIMRRLEDADLGWTLMALARKRAAS
jgi:ubiquinone/menaquinone biosynthesis C-methylase UbiE